MIHVCFGLHDKDGRYSKFTATAMLSLFENHSSPPPSITVHLLHDNTLTPDNRDKFSYIAGRYGQIIKFYNVEELCAEEISQIRKRFANHTVLKRVTIASIYRLLIPQIFPKDIRKIVYLDSDVIVNLDIKELWEVTLEDKPIAAVPESEIEIVRNVAVHYLMTEKIVKVDDYFNAGVMLIDVEQLQKNFSILDEGTNFVANHPQCNHFDQDILNYCFSTNYTRLSEKFDVFIFDERKRNEKQFIRKAIYHYIADNLETNFQDAYNRLWFSYFEKTPFFTKDVVGRLDEGYRRFISQRDFEMKRFASQLTALMAGKERAFSTTPQNLDGLKNFFAVREDEKIIMLENQESLKVLTKSMKKFHGKKVFFILAEGYVQLRNELMKAGFVEGRDFINAAMFLTNVNGFGLNTHELVKIL